MIRRMRNVTRIDKNLTPRWDGEIPSGWARGNSTPKGSVKVLHKFYSKMQHRNEGKGTTKFSGQGSSRPFEGR